MAASNTKILMIGQFPPAVTGESLSNDTVYNILKKHHFSVKTINSDIGKNSNSVGVFSIKKSLSAIKIIIKSVLSVFSSDAIYITPGQTFLGTLRFLPITGISYIFKRKLIIHWHGYGALPTLKKYPILAKLFFNHRAKNVVLTHDFKKKLIEIDIPQDNIIVIKNFSMIPPIADLSIKPKNRRLNVVYLGSLMPEKGFLYFIKASYSTSLFNFTVCGTGSNEYISLANDAHQSFKINYRGLVESNQKESILLNSDILVLQSSYETEGVPLSILEAMSQGCAIIATHHNGIPETVKNSAIFIPPHSSDELLRQLEILNQDRKKLTKLQNAALYRSKEFSLDAFEKNIVNLF